MSIILNVIQLMVISSPCPIGLDDLYTKIGFIALSAFLFDFLISYSFFFNCHFWRNFLLLPFKVPHLPCVPVCEWLMLEFHVRFPVGRE